MSEKKTKAIKMLVISELKWFQLLCVTGFIFAATAPQTVDAQGKPCLLFYINELKNIYFHMVLHLYFIGGFINIYR